jgi:hypothetical protein
MKKQYEISLPFGGEISEGQGEGIKKLLIKNLL